MDTLPQTEDDTKTSQFEKHRLTVRQLFVEVLIMILRDWITAESSKLWPPGTPIPDARGLDRTNGVQRQNEWRGTSEVHGRRK
jgi:hypothetical protein